MWLLAWVACSAPSIDADLAAAREAVAKPAPLPADWEPDLRLRLSRQALAKLTEGEVARHGAITQQVTAGPVKATPKITVESVRVSARKPLCDDCVPLDLALTGTVKVRTPFLNEGWKASLSAKVDVEILTEQADGAWEVKARPRSLRDVEISLPGVPAPIAPSVSGPLRTLVETRLERELQPMPIAKLGSKQKLPLQALRLTSDRKSILAEGRTASPTPGALGDKAKLDGADFVLQLSSDSLIGFAAQAAFDNGVLEQGVLVEPRTLAVDGGSLTAQVRLWHPGSPAWTREYAVTGAASVKGDDIQLRADALEAVGAGPIPALDPLLAFGESLVFDQIADSLELSVPATHDAEVAGSPTSVTLTALDGDEAGAVVVRGTLARDQSRSK
jgi:hypothetical protein